MSVWLAPQVRAAWVETEVVFLDIASDAYLCLVGAGEHLRKDSDGALSSRPPEAVQDLVAAGLLTKAPPAAGVVSPTPPGVTLGLQGEAASVNPLTFLRAVAANRRAAKAIAGRTFEDLLALAGPLHPAAFETPSPSLLAESGRFSRMSPWLPHAGLCLMRSLQQRLYMAALGHGVAWVFGVRTWPFEAHCWLQAGTVVLDDTPARVGGFTPILVV